MPDGPTTRRQFLETGLVSGAALLGMGELPFLRGLAAVSAEEAAMPASTVRFGGEIEPLVRLLEDTPRDRIIEAVGSKIRQPALGADAGPSLAYRDVVAALMLAAVRNIRPGPIVGQKLHAAMVVNAAHLASLASPPAERWMPILWALDEWKRHQAQDVSEGDWTLPALDDAALPAADKAPAALHHAMERWDVEAADHAITAWARTRNLQAIYEALWPYGARDYRDIGHKAIYTANSYRTLMVIGPQHAEAVLRSLVRALLVYRGRTPTADTRVHEPWQHTLANVDRIRAGWQRGTVDTGASRAFLDALRSISAAEAARAVPEMLDKKVAPQSIWDAVFSAAAEHVLQRPRIYSLHAQTTTNALHFAFRTARKDRTKRLLLLQAAAYIPLFRDDNNHAQSGFRSHLDQRTDLRTITLDSLAPRPQLPSRTDHEDTISTAFTVLAEDRRRAAETLLGGLDRGLSPEAVITAARALNFLKGNDSHDYKFSSAILEDCRHLSPPFRARFLVANVGLLRNSAEADNPLVARIRDILA